MDIQQSCFSGVMLAVGRLVGIEKTIGDKVSSENTENVEDLVFRQEDNPKTYRLNREISCETGIH